MSDVALGPEMTREVERLRERGCTVFGPGPMTPGATPPAPGAPVTSPGMHVQVRCGDRFVEGFGGTADEAVRDALVKLAGYDPTGSVIG